MLQARTRRLYLCLLMSAFALGSVTRVNAEQIYFQNGRSMSVKDYRVDGNIITVTLRNGGEASFDKGLVTDIKPNEWPDGAETATPSPAPQPQQAAPTPLGSRPFARLIETVALKHGIDPRLVHAVVQAESNYQPRAKSGVGARGLMQVMPATGKDLGITNLYDPQNNLEAGVRYLKFLLSRFCRTSCSTPDLKRAIAAYNAGPTAVRRYQGIPPFRETQQYVKKVMTNFRD